MSVYIKGMEMPKENEVICVFPNGVVQKRTIKWSTLYEVLKQSNVVPVPDHGRLIDADEKIDQLKTLMEQATRPLQEVLCQYAIDLLGRCPTIIPAEEAFITERRLLEDGGNEVQ